MKHLLQCLSLDLNLPQWNQSALFSWTHWMWAGPSLPGVIKTILSEYPSMLFQVTLFMSPLWDRPCQEGLLWLLQKSHFVPLPLCDAQSASGPNSSAGWMWLPHHSPRAARTKHVLPFASCLMFYTGMFCLVPSSSCFMIKICKYDPFILSMLLVGPIVRFPLFQDKPI